LGEKGRSEERVAEILCSDEKEIYSFFKSPHPCKLHKAKPRRTIYDDLGRGEREPDITPRGSWIKSYSLELPPHSAYCENFTSFMFFFLKDGN